MTNKRVKNHSIETKILLKNRFSCCICRDVTKEIIAHHIDGNPSNTTEENLAVLCLEHASAADAGLKSGKLGAGRKLTPDLVRQFKKTWETKVAFELNVARKILPIRKRKQLEILYEFEINKIKNEILSMPEDSKKLTKQRFDFLGQLLIEEFISGVPFRKMVLNAYSDIAIQSAGELHPSMQLLSAMKDLHLHLVGPDDVPIYSEDKIALLKSLDILQTLADYAASITDDLKLLRKVYRTIIELAEIASWYKFKEFIKKSENIIKKTRKECYAYDKPGLNRTEKNRSIEERINITDVFLKQVREF